MNTDTCIMPPESISAEYLIKFTVSNSIDTIKKNTETLIDGSKKSREN
jgi:hypothetical protein